MTTSLTKITTLTDKRLLEIDNILGSDTIYTLLQSVDSDINYIYSTLKAMRIRCSEADRLYVESMMSVLEEQRFEYTREHPTTG